MRELMEWLGAVLAVLAVLGAFYGAWLFTVKLPVVHRSWSTQECVEVFSRDPGPRLREPAAEVFERVGSVTIIAPEPGPWEVETLRDCHGVDRYWVVAPPQHGGRYGLVIATDVGGQPQAQAKVHAHMLAASSTMLKALWVAFGALRANGYDVGGSDGVHDVVAAAIAKAEGGGA